MKANYTTEFRKPVIKINISANLADHNNKAQNTNNNSFKALQPTKLQEIKPIIKIQCNPNIQVPQTQPINKDKLEVSQELSSMFNNCLLLGDSDLSSACGDPQMEKTFSLDSGASCFDHFSFNSHDMRSKESGSLPSGGMMFSSPPLVPQTLQKGTNMQYQQQQQQPQLSLADTTHQKSLKMKIGLNSQNEKVSQMQPENTAMTNLSSSLDSEELLNEISNLPQPVLRRNNGVRWITLRKKYALG